MKLNVVSAVGDPLDRKTWSGTTYNVSNALREIDSLGDAFEANKIHPFAKIIYRLLYLFYNKTAKKSSLNILGWPLLRKFNAYCSFKQTQKSSSSHTLHFGTLSLPFNKKPKNQRHYLYTDGTWNLWSKYATDIKHVSKSKINRVNELEKTAYHQVDHIFSISHYVKEDIINNYGVSPDKISVVGTGTGIIQPFHGEKDYSNGKILFVAKGRFEDKGGDIVLKAFALASEKIPHLELSVVGQDEYMKSISHPNIKSYGFVSIEKLQTLFNEHSLFVMPALNEPWGLVYIEAMLCKMPIVGLKRNSFPELSGYDLFGEGLDCSDPQILANVIVGMFQNQEMMQMKGNAGQKYALENFTWLRTVNLIMEKIQSLN